MDVATALGVGVEDVWQRMLHRTCGIRPMTRFDHGKYKTDVAGEMPLDVLYELENQTENGATFSLAFYLALRVATRALDQAFANDDAVRSLDRKTLGLVLSTTKADIAEFELFCRDLQQPSRGLFNPFVMARALADVLSIKGPVVAVSGACASGLLAIIHAAQMLERGKIEAVVVVGVDILTDFVLAGFSSLSALDSGPCRPFDKDRCGLSLGEGAGAVVLVPTRSLIGCGRELAVVRGWGVANDARHITAPAETAHGLTVALQNALQTAGMRQEEVCYINAHGTGTRYNDAMEALAIANVFGASVLPVSSMKGYFGHTLGAAGIIETALTATAMLHKTIPASLGLQEKGVPSPIHLARDHLPIDNFSTALTIKSGFGGINAVLILSQTGQV